MNEGGALVSEDGPQGPADDDSARKVTLVGGERVGGCGGLQEEEGKEYADISPNSSVMLVRINTERLECGQKHKNGGPPMPHRERQVHEQLITKGLGGVVLLDDDVNVGDG